MASLLDVMTAVGSAHAGKPLTPEALKDRLLRDPAFCARFNGPLPLVVTFADEETAALAVAFENAGRRS